MHDVFISYEHELKPIADIICVALERKRIRCKCAPRNVVEECAASTASALVEIKVFVHILGEKSHWASNEKKSGSQRNAPPTILFRVDGGIQPMVESDDLDRLHLGAAADTSLKTAIEDLVRKVLSAHDASLVKKAEPQRIQNKYFSSNDSKEAIRLSTQTKLLKSFDQPIYDRLLNERRDAVVLDLGSNDGEFIMDRIGYHPATSKLIGLEYDAEAVNRANKKYGSPSVSFIQCDLEDPDFEFNIQQIMAAHDINEFDVVNMSMILLHLKEPYGVMKILKRHMSHGAVMIIKDVDDGINYAYPDPDCDFDRVYRICSENDASGYRHSGRQIYSLMKRCGMSDIKLEKCGLNTIDMTLQEKQAFFNIYFSFILEDLKIMLNRYPDNERIVEDYQWYSKKYEEFEKRFYSDEFIFSRGFMTYSAINE